MREVNIHIGKRIRLYRKIANLTLEALAEKISKSKATVSKYENGDITIGVETLFLIAQILGVRIADLVDYVCQEVREGEDGNKDEESYNIKKIMYYLYFYDGRDDGIVRSVIETYETKTGEESQVIFYANLEDFNDYQGCKFLYKGSMCKEDSFTVFSFENVNNKLERAFVYMLHSFRQGDYMIGLFLGLSTKPIVPCSFKCILSDKILHEDSELKKILTLSRNELRLIKKMNMLVIN